MHLSLPWHPLGATGWRTGEGGGCLKTASEGGLMSRGESKPEMPRPGAVQHLTQGWTPSQRHRSARENPLPATCCCPFLEGSPSIATGWWRQQLLLGVAVPLASSLSLPLGCQGRGGLCARREASRLRTHLWACGHRHTDYRQDPSTPRPRMPGGIWQRLVGWPASPHGTLSTMDSRCGPGAPTLPLLVAEGLCHGV